MTSLLRSSRLRSTPRLVILLLLAVFTTFLMTSSTYHLPPNRETKDDALARIHTHPGNQQGPSEVSPNIIPTFNSEELQDLVHDSRFYLTPSWKKYLSRDLTINDTLFKPAMELKEKQLLYSTLQQLQEACESISATCMMYGGTLLGSWRHHDIIPWDGDADILVNTTSKDDLFVTLNMYYPAFEAVYTSGRIKFYSQRAKKFSKYEWKWPYIDIWFFNENDTHIWDEYTSKAYKREYVYPKDIVSPTHLRPFGKLLLPAPKDTFRFLQITYATTDCETYFYNHKLEKTERWRFKSVPCRQFKDSIAFVHRTLYGEHLAEKLYRGSHKIHALLVDEPKYAISDPFNLTLL